MNSQVFSLNTELEDLRERLMAWEEIGGSEGFDIS